MPRVRLAEASLAGMNTLLVLCRNDHKKEELDYD